MCLYHRLYVCVTFIYFVLGKQAELDSQNKDIQCRAGQMPSTSIALFSTLFVPTMDIFVLMSLKLNQYHCARSISDFTFKDISFNTFEHVSKSI